VRTKIGIIGAGDIGLNLAEALALKNYDVIIYNRYHDVGGKPSPYWLHKMGRVMDMNDSLQLPGCGEVKLSCDLDNLNGVSYLVITAGAKRTRIDETREELASKNALIIEGFAQFISQNPDTLTLIISNPVDSLTQHLINKVSDITKKPKEKIARKIVGVSYIDSMRLCNIVKETLSEKNIFLPLMDVKGLAIGEHGPTMVPIISDVTLNDKPLSDYFDEITIEEICQHTILRGNDIIKLTGASSVVGPSHAVMHMILAIDNNKDSVAIPCSVWDGKRAIGNLVEFANKSVNKIIDVAKNKREELMFRKSQEVLDMQYKMILERISK
jgi:malate dehydrogenase